jgi:hypothetical protein
MEESELRVLSVLEGASWPMPVMMHFGARSTRVNRWDAVQQLRRQGIIDFGECCGRGFTALDSSDPEPHHSYCQCCAAEKAVRAGGHVRVWVDSLPAYLHADYLLRQAQAGNLRPWGFPRPLARSTDSAKLEIWLPAILVQRRREVPLDDVVAQRRGFFSQFFGAFKTTNCVGVNCETDASHLVGCPSCGKAKDRLVRGANVPGLKVRTWGALVRMRQYLDQTQLGYLEIAGLPATLVVPDWWAEVDDRQPVAV